MRKPVAPHSVLCIHDLSGIGRSGLSVILPLLCTMGCQGVALPSALLGAAPHEDGMPALLNCDTFAQQALDQYRQLGMEFDCIYVSCPGSAACQQLVLDAFSAWPDALKVVDPAMDDRHPLCPGLEALCRAADLIIPDLSEACRLLGRELPGEELADANAQALADELAQRFGGSVIITGAPIGKYTACVGAGRESFVLKRLTLPHHFAGTGDLFGAALVGGLMRGNAVSAAADAAAGFVSASIQATPAEADPRFGSWYETQLYRLAGQIG